MQKPKDEQPATDPLDVASMTREERDRLKRRLVAEHLDAARALGLVREDALA